MGKDYTITITQVVSGNYQPVTNLTQLNLRLTPFSSATYSGTHLGDGVYRFANVEDGTYKLFNDTTEVTKWGGTNGRWIGDDDMSGTYLALTGGTMSGNIAMGSNKLTGLAAGSGNGDSVRYEQVLRTTGTQTGIAAVMGWQGQHAFSGPVPTVTSLPTLSTHVVIKQYVDDEIASATAGVTAYQESVTVRRVMPDGTVEPSKVYTSLAAAVASCTSPSESNQYTIEIEEMNGSYISMPHSAIVDWVHIRGRNRKVRISLGATGESTTVNKTNRAMMFENCGVIMGVGFIADARTYNGIIWNGCDIYPFNNITFQNGKMDGCNIYQQSTKTVTISGDIELCDVDCTQALTFNTFTGIIKRGVTDASDTTLSVGGIADPTSA